MLHLITGSCFPKSVRFCPTRTKKYYPAWYIPYCLDDYQNVTRSKPNPYEMWDREWKAAGLKTRELQPFDISLLPQHLKLRLKPTREFFQPKYRAELSLDYKRRLFGVYGLASGVDPATLFVEPRTDSFDQAVEQATTRPIPEVLEERRRAEREASEAEEKLMKNIKTSLAKMPELLTKYEAQQQKQAEQTEIRELKKKAILEEARDRFGYYVGPQDPKFKKLREEVEEREKLMRKEKRKRDPSGN
ncbi:Growth arrest and DNA damage-inducible proteins-interacting protein 1 [Fasciola hepatica]|uniref:Large ribosomal subunit protein mL64 n=1 Tax=Fasciola hepatica TaxID=6192 RepID=A0A2H1BZ21_FASHE|nr:Growth arrest and DNA damage-inducible proteins-interacting protein 1 [Fasciola hepatica]